MVMMRIRKQQLHDAEGDQCKHAVSEEEAADDE